MENDELTQSGNLLQGGAVAISSVSLEKEQKSQMTRLKAVKIVVSHFSTALGTSTVGISPIVMFIYTPG
jgi:hypothetical protein